MRGLFLTGWEWKAAPDELPGPAFEIDLERFNIAAGAVGTDGGEAVPFEDDGVGLRQFERR
jgi:hypothetical protein